MKKMDFIIIGLTLIFAVFLSIYFGYRNMNGYSETELIINIDGEEYDKIKLIEGYFDSVEINTKHGHNHIRIEGKKVKIESASCDDQLCVKMGYIDTAGQTLICLPNRLVLEIVGEEREIEIDEISY